MIILRILIIIMFQLVTPNVFMVLFSPKHIPIVFNRKTNKVYVNESEFFSLKTRLTPFYLFYPSKKRIQEFEWDDLHCSVIPNHNVNSMISLALMVCHPNTFDVKTHIVLHYCRSSSGMHPDNVRWGWVNNYMYDYADLNEDDTQWGWIYGQFIFPERRIGAPVFNWEDYTKKNKDYDVSLYNWPAWMIEAFDAQSLDELAEIKKKHGVEE